MEMTKASCSNFVTPPRYYRRSLECLVDILRIRGFRAAGIQWRTTTPNVHRAPEASAIPS